MNSGSKNPKVLLDEIAEFMAQEAEEMSDEELLEEVGEESAFSHVEELKKHMEERAAQVRRERLADVRARYESALANRSPRPLKSRPSVVEIRRRIQQVFTNRREMPLGVAFRNGEYQSDEDLFTLWDQLCELGAVDDKES